MSVRPRWSVADGLERIGQPATALDHDDHSDLSLRHAAEQEERRYASRGASPGPVLCQHRHVAVDRAGTRSATA